MCEDQHHHYNHHNNHHHHNYHHHQLAFGTGNFFFLSWVSLLYRDAQCMVKVGAGLSWPIPVKRGIKQGCPISGQLYSLTIEPLLWRLRDRLSYLSLTGTFKSDCGFPTLSAYADNVNIFVFILMFRFWRIPCPSCHWGKLHWWPGQWRSRGWGGSYNPLSG